MLAALGAALANILGTAGTAAAKAAPAVAEGAGAAAKGAAAAGSSTAATLGSEAGAAAGAAASGAEAGASGASSGSGNFLSSIFGAGKGKGYKFTPPFFPEGSKNTTLPKANGSGEGDGGSGEGESNGSNNEGLVQRLGKAMGNAYGQQAAEEEGNGGDQDQLPAPEPYQGYSYDWQRRAPFAPTSGRRRYERS